MSEHGLVYRDKGVKGGSSEGCLGHVKARRLACQGAVNKVWPGMNLSGWRGRQMPDCPCQALKYRMKYNVSCMCYLKFLGSTFKKNKSTPEMSYQALKRGSINAYF